MAARKGAPSNNPHGRPVGSKNRLTVLKEEALLSVLAGKNNPLDFLLTLMSDETAPMVLRVDAAKAAAPYVHKRMPIQIENSDRGPFRVFDDSKLKGMSSDELIIMRSLIAKAQPDGDS